MAREEELKRIDLKVNVSCCDGCRRKVMKAMSLKGVLRTEIQPSHDRVTVVGDVDVKVLVKKLAKVGKIAELLPPAPAASEQGKKQRDVSGGRNDGDRAAPAQAAEEKCKGKDDSGDKAAAKAAPSKHEGCKKCAREAAARAMPEGDNGDHGRGEKKTPSSKDAAAAGWSGEEGGDADGLFGAKPLAVAPDHHNAQAPQAHYHRAEPAMVVPYYGYYGMPPPPPPMMMPMAPPAQRHPQPSRFDEDYFNDDNTVGCSVM
ncbi:heavy metal-associated isoprenylated plant protein 35-like [Miscanthus floridulus]|uniref:heavy metal-associated isoprenylated plant protein 35-like n=1 Tax=Miscanthus floridulus TaxID=154761 RepID=UPI0034577F8C